MIDCYHRSISGSNRPHPRSRLSSKCIPNALFHLVVIALVLSMERRDLFVAGTGAIQEPSDLEVLTLELFVNCTERRPPCRHKEQ